MPITNTIFSTLPLDVNMEISKGLSFSDLISLSLTSKQTAAFFKPALQKCMVEKLLKHIIDGNEKMIRQIINIKPEMMFNTIKHDQLGCISPLTYIFSIHYGDALEILFNALTQQTHITLFYNKLQEKIEDINLTQLIVAEKEYNNKGTACKSGWIGWNELNEAWGKLGRVQLSNIPMHLIRSVCPGIDMIKRPVALYARYIVVSPFYAWSVESHFPMTDSRRDMEKPKQLNMKKYYLDLFEKNKMNFINKVNGLTQLIENKNTQNARGETLCQ